MSGHFNRENVMEEQYFFHVISDIPKKVGEHIILDDKHPNGVHKRVYEELETVNDIQEAGKI